MNSNKPLTNYQFKKWMKKHYPNGWKYDLTPCIIDMFTQSQSGKLEDEQ